MLEIKVRNDTHLILTHLNFARCLLCFQLNEPTTRHIYQNLYNGEVVLEVSDGTLTAVDKAQVSVKSAKDLKKETIAVLEPLEGDEKLSQRLIESVIKSIKRSLREKFWQDNSRLNPKIMRGATVFNLEKAAILKLKAAQKTGNIIETELQIAIDKLTKADELLAEIALQETRESVNGVENSFKKKIAQKFLKKAEKEIRKAKKFLDNGKETPAVSHFKKSWIFSMLAEKLACQVI